MHLPVPRMKRPIVYVKDWNTGQTVTINPRDCVCAGCRYGLPCERPTRTVNWAVALVLRLSASQRNGGFHAHALGGPNPDQFP